MKSGNETELSGLLKRYYPPDLADAMEFLDDATDLVVFTHLDDLEAAEVLDELDDRNREQLVSAVSPQHLAQLLKMMPADDAADVVSTLPAGRNEAVLAELEQHEADDIRLLLKFPRHSAGGIMSVDFVAVSEDAPAATALQTYRDRPEDEAASVIFIIDAAGGLVGTVSLREILAADPQRIVSSLVMRDVPRVPASMDQEEVARIFARYDLNAMPVVDDAPGNRLVGVITADDIIDVIVQESTEDILRMAGSDAQEMEQQPPARIALRRLPWIMATMFIELLAGFVIRYFDPTLARILLLASFMPIISAISGNTGLQSATIIVRGISTGAIQATEWTRAVRRQLVMTLILGSATGLVLGTIGAIWYGKWTFGLVVAVGMFVAVNIAGVVGTLVPLTSKRLGFDPAITSGPFETAFQDVIGISIFLGLATLMARYIIR